MNKKERDRKAIFELMLSGSIIRQDACKRLKLSSRQLRRSFARYREKGDVGLVHKSRGKRSTHALSDEIKSAVLKA